MTAHPARWFRPAPRRSVPAADLQRLISAAFPQTRILDAHALAEGLRHSNFKLLLDDPPISAVLRIYEHDPSLCQKEADLMRLVARSVPVPEILHLAPDGLDDLPPFAVLRYVEGITFRELRRTGDTDAIAEASRSAGATLAAIGRFSFGESGWIAPGPSIGAPLLEGADPMPRFVDLCLASPDLQRRMPADLRHRVSASIWSAATQLAPFDRESRLVHGDFGRRNLLVHCDGGRWSVAAVLDWEFAVSGSPLIDIANFLRYERTARPIAEPHFSAGYRDAGGILPADWRRLARLVDLAALCESLTHGQLPEDVERELVDLVRATIENRDPP